MGIIPKDKQRRATPAQRERIYELQNGRCGKCQRAMTKSEMEMHHFIQHAYGGGSNDLNFIGLHKSCHAEITKAQASVRNEFKGYGGV